MCFLIHSRFLHVYKPHDRSCSSSWTTEFYHAESAWRGFWIIKKWKSGGKGNKNDPSGVVAGGRGQLLPLSWILNCRKIVRTFLSCRKLIVQKCKIWGLNTLPPFLENKEAKWNIFSTRHLLCRKFARCLSENCNFLPAYCFNPRRRWCVVLPFLLSICKWI